MTIEFQILHQAPTAAEYCALRSKAGMGPRTLDAATIGLKNSLFAVSIHQDNVLIAMGRVIGDGGCHVQITDIAVDPQFQGRGLGKMIMREIMQFIETTVPRSCFVNLFADVNFLYERYGFVVSRKSIGMHLDWSKIGNTT